MPVVRSVSFFVLTIADILFLSPESLVLRSTPGFPFLHILFPKIVSVHIVPFQEPLEQDISYLSAIHNLLFPFLLQTESSCSLLSLSHEYPNGWLSARLVFPLSPLSIVHNVSLFSDLSGLRTTHIFGKVHRKSFEPPYNNFVHCYDTYAHLP